MASKVSVCIRALKRIGLDRINALTEDNPRAEACNDLYTPVKEDTLSQFPWDFAIKRVTLTSIVATPDFGYAYYFQRPADMLYAVDEDSEIPFVMEGDKLLADDTTLKIRYVFKDVLEAYFSPLFAKLFAINLAIELTYEFEDKLESRAQLLAEKELVEDEARFAISLNGEPENYEANAFIDVRRATSVGW